MGCGESKIQTIHLTSSEDWDLDQEQGNNKAKDLWAAASSVVRSDGGQGEVREVSDPWAGLETRGVLPHSLLETIPSGDLGESLDIRRLREADLGDKEEAKLSRSAPVSANSLGEAEKRASGFDINCFHCGTSHDMSELCTHCLKYLLYQHSYFRQWRQRL